jgi:hypothetical protein
MPNAGDAGDHPSLPTVTGEPPDPPWWRRFLAKCDPNARMRNFSRVQEIYPDVVKEGL